MADLLNIIGTKYADRLTEKSKNKAVIFKKQEDSATIREEVKVNEKIFKQQIEKRKSEADSEIKNVYKKDDKLIKPILNTRIYAPKGSLVDRLQQMKSDITENKKNNDDIKEERRLTMQNRLKKVRDRIRHEEQMQKNRRVNKIKSKNFHKHKKQFNLREILKKQDCKNEVELIAKDTEKLDKERVRERVTQRHKQTSKLQRLKQLARKDENARDILNKTLQLGIEKRQRRDDIDDDSDEVNNQEISEDEKEYLVEDESEADVASDEEIVQVGNISKALETMKGAPSVTAFLEKQEKQRSYAERSSKFISQLTRMEKNKEDDEDVVNDDFAGWGDDGNMIIHGDDGEGDCQNTTLVCMPDDGEAKRKFDEDNEVEIKEYQKSMEVCTYRPGVNSWTGPSYAKRDKERMEKATLKAPMKNRRPRKGVYIDEKLNENQKKWLVTTIPYPYNTAEQYQMAMQQPVDPKFSLYSQIPKSKKKNPSFQPLYPRRFNQD